MTNSIALNNNDINRFWKYVDVRGDNECWEWTAGKSDWGYGLLTVSGKRLKASRISWWIHKNQDPWELDVLHTCDNPPCCNPNHLFLGTQKDNSQDMTQKGRHGRLGDGMPGERNGNHKLTEKDISEIRMKYIPREYSLSMLAKEYGISKRQIERIVKNKSWWQI